MLENHKPELSGHHNPQHQLENLAGNLWHDMMLTAHAAERTITNPLHAAQAGIKSAEHLVIEPLFKTAQSSEKTAEKFLLNPIIFGSIGVTGMVALCQNIGRDLRDHGFAKGVADGIEQGVGLTPAVGIWNVAKPWLNKHGGVKDFLIDLASGAAATAAGVLGIETGPGAIAIAMGAGALTNAALHKAFGDKVTAGTFVNGAIDGLAGNIGGALEKAAAKKLTELGARAALESGLAKIGLESAEKHVANVLIKGAAEIGTETKALGTAAVRVEQALIKGTDTLRNNIYSNLISNPAGKIAEFVMHHH